MKGENVLATGAVNRQIAKLFFGSHKPSFSVVLVDRVSAVGVWRMNAPIREQARPNIGERHTAKRFCLSHISVSTAGNTADDIMTPYHAVRGFVATQKEYQSPSSGIDNPWKCRYLYSFQRRSASYSRRTLTIKPG